MIRFTIPFTPRAGIEPAHPEGSRLAIWCNTIMRPRHMSGRIRLFTNERNLIPNYATRVYEYDKFYLYKKLIVRDF